MMKRAVLVGPLAGADAIGGAEQKIAALQADIESNRTLSVSLDFDK